MLTQIICEHSTPEHVIINNYSPFTNQLHEISVAQAITAQMCGSLYSVVIPFHDNLVRKWLRQHHTTVVFVAWLIISKPIYPTKCNEFNNISWNLCVEIPQSVEVWLSCIIRWSWRDCHMIEIILIECISVVNFRINDTQY